MNLCIPSNRGLNLSLLHCLCSLYPQTTVVMWLWSVIRTVASPTIPPAGGRRRQRVSRIQTRSSSWPTASHRTVLASWMWWSSMTTRVPSRQRWVGVRMCSTCWSVVVVRVHNVLSEYPSLLLYLLHSIISPLYTSLPLSLRTLSLSPSLPLNPGQRSCHALSSAVFPCKICLWKQTSRHL